MTIEHEPELRTPHEAVDLLQLCWHGEDSVRWPAVAERVWRLRVFRPVRGVAVGLGVGCGRSTLWAGPVQIEVMGDLAVAVLANEIGGVVFQGGGGKSDGAAASPAQQVVPVFGRVAQSVQDFAVFGTLGFGDSVVGKATQDAVDA